MLLWPSCLIYITERYQQSIGIGLLRNLLKKTRDLRELRQVTSFTSGIFLAAALWLVTVTFTVNYGRRPNQGDKFLLIFLICSQNVWILL